MNEYQACFLFDSQIRYVRSSERLKYCGMYASFPGTEMYSEPRETSKTEIEKLLTISLNAPS